MKQTKLRKKSKNKIKSKIAIGNPHERVREIKKERVVILAEKIKLLFGFIADLIKDKDLLKETLGVCEDRQNFAVSAAPILGAFGMDYEEQEFESGMRKERVEALLNLVEVLEKTEKDQLEFQEKQAAKIKGREQLKKILGI